MLRSLLLAIAAAVATLPALADERPSPLVPSPSWEAIRVAVVGEGEIRDGAGLYVLEAPFRAHDAATVPIRIVQMEGAPDVRRLTLVIDDNPAPIAAEFTFGAAMVPLDLETRVRVDVYTNVRAIVETTDGALYMTGRYVRASGGCSAPASKDAAAALAALGQMQVRWHEGDGALQGGRSAAQVTLRHPNYSGLQRNPLTLLPIPAHFVDSIEVRQGDEVVFSMIGSISISEDPTLRFAFADTGASGLQVTATDTKGATFGGSFVPGI